MSEEEIKLALECCSEENIKCLTCPLFGDPFCHKVLAKNALSLIEKKNAENENAISQALNEFAEQVKMAFYYEFEELIPSIMADRIDRLLEEKRNVRKMTAKQTLKAIKKMGEYIEQINFLKEYLQNEDFFLDIDWDVVGIYRNCKIEDGVLYDSEGNDISNDGNCMDEEIPYFVNQYTGYCGDDFHGTMYVKVDDDNTFVAIHYDC